MKVRVLESGISDPWGRPGAVLVGFYNNIQRRVGDVFALVDEADFDPVWMEVVDDSTPSSVPRRGEAKPGKNTRGWNGIGFAS